MSSYEEIIYSENFKNWFGDWENDPENASKVVDEEGKPLIMYHGSLADFDTFDISKTGKNWGGFSSHGRGIYFTGSPEAAELWVRRGMESTQDFTGKPKIYSVFLNIRNPYTNDRLAKSYYNQGPRVWNMKNTAHSSFLDWGYDGFFGQCYGDYLAVATSPNQIKSINNAGDFSLDSDNIYERKLKHRRRFYF